MERAATVVRKTKETNIELTLGLDGGEVVVDTGVGFFDHMLTALAVHGGFGLRLKAEGDWNVDCHHTVEDTGIVLGRAFKQALGDRSGIVLTVDTDQPGMQLYTANFLTERRGKQGAIYAPRCALCLETQYFPNAMACDGFEKPILRAGDLWRHCTTLIFSGKR